MATWTSSWITTPLPSCLQEKKVRTSLLGQKNLFNIQFSENIHHDVIVKVEDWELEQRKLQGKPVNDVRCIGSGGGHGNL